MQIVKDIYLDFYQSEPVLVTAKEGDVGRYLHVTLLDNGNIFPVPSGSTVTFSRDDVWNGCTVNDDGTILAPITADMRPGRVPAQIEVSSGNDHLSSWNFILNVQNSARNDAAIEGNNDFSAIQTLLDQVQDAIDDTNTAIANVNAAITNMGQNFASLANTQNITQLATNVKTLVGGINELNSKMPNNAGSHNSIYRGISLGSSVTQAQWNSISAGTFEDLYIGDYWAIGGVNWRIAAFDYFYNTADTAFTKHHAVIVPDRQLYAANMNDANTTEGAYVNSKMRTENLEQAKTTIKNAFGESHVLSHRLYLSNATSNGRTSAGGWYDSDVELMTEHMVYGNGVFSPVSDGNSVPNNYRIEKSQLPLFTFRPDLISNQQWYWLRDVISSASFARVGGRGDASCADASGVVGVRPAFCIGQS